MVRYKLSMNGANLGGLRTMVIVPPDSGGKKRERNGGLAIFFRKSHFRKISLFRLLFKYFLVEENPRNGGDKGTQTKKCLKHSRFIKSEPHVFKERTQEDDN